MYEELVKQLQYCATHDCTIEGEVEVGCTAPYEEREGVTTCNDVLMLKAADAIEELNKQVELEHQSGFADGQIAANRKKLHWVPVTERLPEKDGQVLAYYGFNRGDGYLGMMFMQVLEYYATDPKPHFQHESMGVTVTHWMPLQEPPKEEK